MMSERPRQSEFSDVAEMEAIAGDPDFTARRESAGTHSRPSATENERRIREVLALPLRAWDEGDADSPEARSARAYNHALATAWAILRP